MPTPEEERELRRLLAGGEPEEPPAPTPTPAAPSATAEPRQDRPLTSEEEVRRALSQSETQPSITPPPRAPQSPPAVRPSADQPGGGGVGGFFRDAAGAVLGIPGVAGTLPEIAQRALPGIDRVAPNLALGPLGEVALEGQRRAGLIPEEARGLEATGEGVGLPATYFGGSAVDAFNRIRAGERPAIADPSAFTEDPRDVLARQRGRPFLTRLASEALNPVDLLAGPGLVRGAGTALSRQSSSVAQDVAAAGTRQVVQETVPDVVTAPIRGIGPTPRGAVITPQGIRPSQVPYRGDTTEALNQFRQAVQSRGVDQATEIADVRQSFDEAEHVARILDSPDPPVPPRTPGDAVGADMPPPRRPEQALMDDFEVPSWEAPSQRAMAKWQGAINLEGATIESWMRESDSLLKRYGLKADRETMLPVFEALHGERPVTALNAVQRRVYDKVDILRRVEEREFIDFLTAFEDAGYRSVLGTDIRNFATRMMANPDYFPRGWKQPAQVGITQGRRGLGARPSFTRPRADASFSEMLAANWEPASWDPFAMMARRRMDGVRYRATVTLHNRLKQLGYILPENQAPEGWRVPQLGPVFEGTFPNTQRQAVPPDLVKALESTFNIDPKHFGLREISRWANALKRAKFIASFFQHADITTRGVAAGFTPTGVSRGAPLKTPSLAWKLLKAQWWPKARHQRMREWAKGVRIYQDRKMTIRSDMLIEEGLEIRGDLSLIEREFTQDLVPELRRSFPGARYAEPFRKMQQFFERGLFEGIYREIQFWSLENFIIPQIRRTRPNATARQVAAEAAEAANVIFSTLGPWQTIIKDPLYRDAAKLAFFSLNESESLMRSGMRAIGFVPGRGSIAGLRIPLKANPHGALFREWYLGLFIVLAGAANVINFAATGKPLPKESYVPIKINDPYGPFRVGYNGQFLAPQMPGVKGPADNPVYIDLVGQMDTFFRWALDPVGAFSARINVVPRAIKSQVTGKTFSDRPLGNPLRPEDSLTKAEQRQGKTKTRESLEALRNRAVQAGIDLAAPIGGTSILGAAATQFETVRDVVPDVESKLGTYGLLVQSSGLNLRAETIDNILRDRYPNYDLFPSRTRRILRDQIIDEIYGEE